MDILLLFPGQGSQKPGMARELADSFAEAHGVLARANDALGFQLSRVMFDGPADELTATHNAQPALLTHGMMAWEVIRDRAALHVRAAAGHSLGEHTAYCAAGSVALENAVRLVRRRGELMHEAGVARPGAMAAILGVLERPIEDICAQASREAGGVVPANYNSNEQTVISGETGGVERAMELAKNAGAKRTLRLPVAGAFHSPLMAPAATGLKAAIAATSYEDPAFPVYSNVTEQPVSDASTGREVLHKQLTSPVRWLGLVRNMAAAYPDALWIELGPGAVLSGLVARIVKGVRTMPCGTPADVAKVLEAVS